MADKKELEKQARRLRATLEMLVGAVDTEYTVYGASSQLQAALENAEKTLEELNDG